MSDSRAASDPKGLTGQLCHWAYDFNVSQAPEHIQLRAKLIILDGLGCGLIGAHLPWSERAAKAVLELEPPGNCSLLGWEDRLLSAPAAAVANSTFIQAFELDDWHPHAPLHSAALLLPALSAAYDDIWTCQRIRLDRICTHHTVIMISLLKTSFDGVQELELRRDAYSFATDQPQVMIM